MTDREIIVAFLRDNGKAIWADYIERGMTGDKPVIVDEFQKVKEEAFARPAPVSDDARAKHEATLRDMAHDPGGTDAFIQFHLGEIADFIAKDGERQDTYEKAQRWLRAANDALASQVAELKLERDGYAMAFVPEHEAHERAKKQVAELRKALTPFADEAAEIAEAEAESDHMTPDDMDVDGASLAGTNLTMADLRAARAALANSEGGQS